LSWIAGLCLTCIAGSLVRLCVVQDEKSGIGKALHFLSSLILVFGVISPFLPPFPEGLSLPQVTVETGETVDAAAMLLKKSTERIQKDVQTAFPGIDFDLAIDTEAEEMEFILSCREEREERLLCSYIETKYQLPCRPAERK